MDESKNSIDAGFPEYLKNPKDRSELGGQSLVRAIGKNVKTVIDATAGLGRDSYTLAVYGYDVTSYERCADVAEMLKAGLTEALDNPSTAQFVSGHLKFISGDSIQELDRIDNRPDAIYLDPMYPPKRRKSALAKKEIQFLRQLVGDDTDSYTLFKTAMEIAKDRVVVKRPHYAEPVLDKPSMSYQGKLVRFDVYLTSLGSWDL